MKFMTLAAKRNRTFAKTETGESMRLRMTDAPKGWQRILSGLAIRLVSPF
jgi:hypothetical protein